MTRRHLYDLHLPNSELAKFSPSDITLINKMPSTVFRAHFEVYIGKTLHLSPSREYNLWICLVWVFAAIEQLHKGNYGTYNCSDAIDYIFIDGGTFSKADIHRIDF